MSRPPIATKISDTVQDLYTDAKQIIDPSSESELVRKLAVIQSINEKLNRQLTASESSSRPDRFTQRKLRTALEDNQVIERSVQSALERIRGSAALRLEDDARLREYAERIARLERLLEQKEAERQATIRQLEDQFSLIKQSHSRVESEIAAKDAEIANLRRLTAQLPDSERLRQRIIQLEREREELQAGFDRRLLEKDQERIEKTRQLNQCSSAFSESQRAVQQALADVQRLQREREAARLDLERVEQEQEKVNRIQQDRIDQLTRDLAQITGDLDAASASAEQIITGKSAVDAEVSRLQQQLRQAEENLQACQAGKKRSDEQVATLSREHDGLESRIREKEMEHEKLERQIQDGKDRISRLDRELVKAQSEKEEKNLVEEAARLREFEEKLSMCEIELKDLKQRLEVKTNELERQVRENETLLENKKQLEASVDTSVKQLREQQTQQQREADRVKAATAVCDQLKERIESLETEIESKNAALRERDAEIARLRQASTDAERSISRVESLKLEKEGECKFLEEQQEQLQSTINRLDQEKAQLMEQIQLERQSKEDLGERLEKKQKELGEIREELSVKEKELQEKTKSLQEKTQAFEQHLRDEQAGSSQQIAQAVSKSEEAASKAEQAASRAEQAELEKTQAVTQVVTELEKEKAKSSVLEQLVSDAKEDLKQAQAESRREIAQLEQAKQSAQQKIQTLEQEIDQIKETMKKEQVDTEKKYQAEKREMEQQMELLSTRLSALTEESQKERASFELALEQSKESLKLSEEKVVRLNELVEDLKKDQTASLQEVVQGVEQREKQIAELQKELQELTKRDQEVINGMRVELEKCKEDADKLIASTESKIKQAEESLKSEQERGLLEKGRRELELEQLKSEKGRLDDAVKTLNREQQDLTQRLEESQARVRELEEKMKPKEIEPEAIEQLSDILKEELKQEQLVQILEEQLQILEKSMKTTLSIYKKLVGEIVEPLVDADRFGKTNMKMYILSTLYMFHAWKGLLRIPVILRGGDPSNPYFYPIPKDEALTRLLDMLGSNDVRTSFQSKAVDGKMRVDVLLYYITVGLMRKMDSNPEQIEYKPVILYLREFLTYANKKLEELIQKTISLHNTSSNSVRIAHDKTSPIITFVRLSSQTPTDTNKRLKYEIKDDQVFHLEYDERPIAFYEPVRNAQDIITDWREKDDLKLEYTADYWFGPFTNVFPPTAQNDDICSSDVFRENIELRLRQGNPVCIIGYGASGSGKTTTLVYADFKTYIDGIETQVKKPGILILLANNLAREWRGYKGFDRCKVGIYELEVDPEAKKDPATEGICRKYPAADDKNTILRVTRTGANSFAENLVPYEECDKQSDLRLVYDRQEDGEWKSPQDGEGLEKQLIEYINIKRNIAPSPNNPQSSRSHVICILTFLNQESGQTTSLIVCDFAGVENRFNCQDQASLDNMGIPRFVEMEKVKLLGTLTQNLKKFPFEQKVKSMVDGVITNLEESPLSYVPKAGVLVLTPERLSNVLLFCEYMISSLQSVKIDLKGLVRDFYNSVLENNPDNERIKKTVTSLDITRIDDYRKVTTTVANNKAFKAGGPTFVDPYGGLYRLAISMPGYKILANQHEVFTGFKTPPDESLPYLIRLVVWFMKSYADPKDDGRYVVANVLQHSALSSAIRDAVDMKESEDAKRFILPKDVIETSIKTRICTVRVNEGLFINKSLQQLRQFIGYTLQRTKQAGTVAPFIDQCAPIQCNPYYRDCFGQNEYFDPAPVRLEKRLPKEFGLLSDYIMRVDNSDKITFCIINVVNLSKNANNPPPSPYIDISDLLIEYEKIISFFPPGQTTQESLLALSKASVDTSVVMRIANHPLLGGNVSPVFIKELRDYATEIIKGRGNLRDNMNRLIQHITNFNAITAVGTLEFTDMMSKYAVNRVVCNLREPPKFPANFSYYPPPKIQEVAPPPPASPRSPSPARAAPSKPTPSKPATRTSTGVISRKQYGK
jgi:chromosome segregation ATPase